MLRQRFRKDDSNHLVCTNIFQSDRSVLYSFANEVVTYIDVLGPGMAHGTLSYRNSPLVVFIYFSWSLWRFSHVCQQPSKSDCFLSGRTGCYILCFCCRQCDGSLLFAKPTYCPTSQWEHVSWSGKPVIHITRPICIWITNEISISICISIRDMQLLSDIWGFALLLLNDFVWDWHRTSTQLSLLGRCLDELRLQHEVGFLQSIDTRSHQPVC